MIGFFCSESMNQKQKDNSSNRKHTKILIGLVVLLILSNIGFVVWRPNKNKEEKINQYPLIDPARAILNQEDYIVNFQSLKKELNDYVETLPPNSISIYFEMLHSGSNISINPDLPIWPASLMKLPVALAVMKKVEKGEWLLNNELVLSSEDQDNSYGDLYRSAVGTTFTIDTLIKTMLVKSDNTAYKILVRNLEPSDLNEIVEDLGLDNLFTKEGKVTAKEYTRLFRVLYISSYLTLEHSNQLLEWMTESSFNQYLAAGIPDEIKFSHKIGENAVYKTYGDSGIIYLGTHPYMLTVMVQQAEGSTEEQKMESSKIMEHVSKVIYDYVISK